MSSEPKINKGWAVVPGVDPSSEVIGLGKIQIPDTDGNTPEEMDRLRQIIRKNRHLLTGKKMPIAGCQGCIFHIDVGNAKIC